MPFKTGVKNPELSMAALMDISERMQSLEEWQTLTELEKKMCFEHVHYPELTKSEISHKLGCSKSFTYSFFQSKKWEILNTELARQQMRELVQLSVKTLRTSMLIGTPAVKLDAATRVLVNAGLLVSPHGKNNIKTDNKMIVLLSEADRPNSEGQISGDTNSVHAASETAGSPRLAGPLQDNSGRPPVGQDNSSHQ